MLHEFFVMLVHVRYRKNGFVRWRCTESVNHPSPPPASFPPMTTNQNGITNQSDTILISVVITDNVYTFFPLDIHDDHILHK